MWVKYRHSFSSGYGDTGFVEVPEMDRLRKEYGGESNKDDLEDLVSSYLEDYSINIGCSYWSEHYRGFSVEAVDHPTSEWLMRRIKRYRSNTEFYTDQADRYQKILDKVGFITKDESDVI